MKSDSMTDKVVRSILRIPIDTIAAMWLAVHGEATYLYAGDVSEKSSNTQTRRS